MTKDRRGPGRPTRKQAEQRDLELLDKALDLFLEKGFERTTIDAITASVGMAKRTVYQRYGNKTRLFKASLHRAIEEWIVPVERLRAAETDNIDATLLRIGQILVTNIMSPAGLRLMRITNAESGRMPDIGAFTHQLGTGPTIAYLTDLIRRRIRPAGIEVPDPGEAALAFLNLVVGGPANMTAWGLVLDATAIAKNTRYCVHLFLHGLLDAQANNTPKQQHFPSQQTVVAAQDLHELQAIKAENQRLKVLLAESMLEVAALTGRSRAW